MAHGTHGKVGKEPDHASLFEKGAKENEEEDISGGDVGGGSVDAFCAKPQGAYDLVDTKAPMGQRPRQVVPK